MKNLLIKCFWLFLIIINFNIHAEESLEQGVISPDINRILQRGKLIVAMYYEDVPPLFMHNKKNEFIGLDVEIARDIAEKLGVEIVFDRNPKTYDEIVQYVFNKKVDIAISAVSDTLERAKLVRFSKPYIALKQSLLINRLELSKYKNHRYFKDFQRLFNQKTIRLGVIEGSSYIDFAKKDFPNAQLEIYKKLSEGVADTKAAKITAFLYDEIEIKNWMREHPEDSLYLRTHLLTANEDTLAFVVRWEDKQLLHWLNLYIDKSKKGFFKLLEDKYLVK